MDIPYIDISGFFSSTWFYIAIIGFVGFILVAAISIFLFFFTYNKKIVLFENISGQGYQPLLKTRARSVKLKISGEEVLKPLFINNYFSSYGRKMGKNTYWYAKGQDGYFYNVILGDLDSKRAMLDIEPIDRDVRMFHVALDRIAQTTYGKQSFLEKYGVHMLLFAFLIVLILGMWFIVGKIGDAVEPLGQQTETAAKLAEMNEKVLDRLDSVARVLGGISDSGVSKSGLESAG